MEDLQRVQGTATEIYCDNMSTIAMTRNPVFHGRTEHIKIRHQFLRDVVGQGIIAMELCPTDDRSFPKEILLSGTFLG